MSHYLMALEREIICNLSSFDNAIASILEFNKGNSVKSSFLLFNSRFIKMLEPWIDKYGLDNLHIVDGDTFAKYPVEELQKN